MRVSKLNTALIIITISLVIMAARYLKKPVLFFSQGKEEYKTRKISQIRRIVVHHSASARDRTTPSMINDWHVQRGWPGIGYHFLIDGRGDIFQTQPIDVVSYHVGGNNTPSVGICLTGNFETESPSAAQLTALQRVVRDIQQITGKKLEIVGHRDLTATLCPGKNLYPLIKTLS